MVEDHLIWVKLDVTKSPRGINWLDMELDLRQVGNKLGPESCQAQPQRWAHNMVPVGGDSGPSLHLSLSA